MIDDKIAKAKALIEERERIDRELSALFGLADAPKRGRPRKDNERDARHEETIGAPANTPPAGGNSS
jgi:hypothetical protein